MKRQITIGVILMIAAVGIAASDRETSRDTPQRDIYGTPMPMGKLGHPIGTYMKIEGIRAERGKVGVNTLLVDNINGEKPDQPVGVWIQNINALPKGKRCVLAGYESGKWIGTPPDVIKRFGNVATSQAPWHFYRYFVVISAERPVELKKKFPPKASSVR